MTFEEAVQKFIDNPCYLTNGAGQLSTKWEVSKDIIKTARKEARNRINNLALYGTQYDPKDVAFEAPTKPKGKLLKRWGKDGAWQESYSFEEAEEKFDINKIISSIDFNNIKVVKLPRIEKSNKVLNLYLADQHIGASVSNGLYTNHFDDVEYNTRMGKVFEKVQEMGTFDKINILFLGDTFDGQDGYTVKRTHSLPQNMSNNEAFETGIRVNMDFIDSLTSSNCANNYNIYCVSDSNHGGVYGLLFVQIPSRDYKV